eukprot:3368169-Prymnesium_polylepis.1
MTRGGDAGDDAGDALGTYWGRGGRACLVAEGSHLRTTGRSCRAPNFGDARRGVSMSEGAWRKRLGCWPVRAVSSGRARCSSSPEPTGRNPFPNRAPRKGGRGWVVGCMAKGGDCATAGPAHHSATWERGRRERDAAASAVV